MVPMIYSRTIAKVANVNPESKYGGSAEVVRDYMKNTYILT